MPNKPETPANVEDVGQPKREASLAAPNGYAASWDEEDEWPGTPDEYDCHDCKDSGKVVAMDGYHEYLGYDYVPCHCSAALRWVGRCAP